jgi:ribosome modulation factor
MLLPIQQWSEGLIRAHLSARSGSRQKVQTLEMAPGRGWQTGTVVLTWVYSTLDRVRFPRQVCKFSTLTSPSHSLGTWGA